MIIKNIQKVSENIVNNESIMGGGTTNLSQNIILIITNKLRHRKIVY